VNPALTPAQLSFLRSRAHPLEPTVQLGKAGVSEGFLRVLEDALKRNELIKLRLGRRVEVDLKEVAAKVKSHLVHKVGRIVVLYRPFAEPQIVLPAPEA